jgi:hypothetical protein
MTSDSVTRIAEKIADDYGINPNWGRQESLRWIESLLREAMAYKPCKMGHVNHGCPMCSIKEATQEAYTRAAEVARTQGCDGEYCRGGFHDPACPIAIAAAIEKLKGEAVR